MKWCGISSARRLAVMIVAMKIYTKTGDDGSTSLFGPERVGKDHMCVETYGTVDELNSVLGLASCACRFKDLQEILLDVQNQLFDLGADLAASRLQQADNINRSTALRIDANHVSQLEKHIDTLDAKVPALSQFVIPGGSEMASRLHHARTVCRRAERCCVALDRGDRLGGDAMAYLNRLSDLLFVMARWANRLEGIEDVVWPREDD